MVVFAKYNESPLTVNDIIISKGINNINVWSFSMNNFLIAGSSSHAIADVLPATKIEKKDYKKILFINFFE